MADMKHLREYPWCIAVVLIVVFLEALSMHMERLGARYCPD